MNDPARPAAGETGRHPGTPRSDDAAAAAPAAAPVTGPAAGPAAGPGDGAVAGPVTGPGAVAGPGDGAVAGPVTGGAGLAVDGLVLQRGGLTVVHGVSLAVPYRAITVLLGPNGAGKTTLLDGISGAIPSRSGTITLDGERLDGTRPIRRGGIAHVEQGRTVFARLTVEENLRVAASGDPQSMGFALFPELARRRRVRAGLLSGGEQQMLVIARALVARPKVLLLDEMSLGLAPVIVRRLLRTVRELADEGMAVLLVEQFAALALGVGDGVYVLSRGRVVFDGTCRTLRADPDLLQDAYLGRPR